MWATGSDSYSCSRVFSATPPAFHSAGIGRQKVYGHIPRFQHRRCLFLFLNLVRFTGAEDIYITNCRLEKSTLCAKVITRRYLSLRLTTRAPNLPYPLVFVFSFRLHHKQPALLFTQLRIVSRYINVSRVLCLICPLIQRVIKLKLWDIFIRNPLMCTSELGKMREEKKVSRETHRHTAIRHTANKKNQRIHYLRASIRR